jgi:hypothetical protein
MVAGRGQFVAVVVVETRCIASLQDNSNRVIPAASRLPGDVLKKDRHDVPEL